MIAVPENDEASADTLNLESERAKLGAPGHESTGVQGQIQSIAQTNAQSHPSS
jgi:hypothetical protein